MCATRDANFWRMTFCFGVNHGCVVTVSGLAYGLLGNTGSYMNGALYLSYALSALLLSTPCVQRFGPRAALVGATALQVKQN